jgi:hypothetical protein
MPNADDILIGQAAHATGVPVHLDLAPGAADHVLAHGALEQPEQRPPDAPDVGASKIDRRDQGLGLLGQALVSGQRIRAPFRHLALQLRTEDVHAVALETGKKNIP